MNTSRTYKIPPPLVDFLQTMPSSSSSSSSSSVLCFILLISLLSCIPSSHTKSTTIHIPLHKITKTHSSNPIEKITHQAHSSLTRAKHLRSPHKTHPSKTPLSPKSYGGYSISLSFGTPPQTLPFVLDTGSELVWFPCTERYLCEYCIFPSSDPSNFPAFLPKVSSSANGISCQNPKCGWIHGEDVQSRCQECPPNSGNCTQKCPRYNVPYGSGSTNGTLIHETLALLDNNVTNVAVGCSNHTYHIPTGIAGFGRTPISLPSQLGLSKFSYCLVSQQLNDTSKNTPLVLYGDGSESEEENSTSIVNAYTSLIQNPGRPVYYYVGLRKITVEGNRVDIPLSYLTLGSDGNGGTIVDSGSTFTFMERRIFNLFANELENHMMMPHFKRVIDMETSTGLGRCYEVQKEGVSSWPKIAFHFAGAAKMELAFENTFKFVDENQKVACLSIVTGADLGTAEVVSNGPGIILGNAQQHNFYVEFDLKNERFGFRKQSCN